MRFFSFFVLSILLYSLYGQEICGNGIDDDGDLLIDCYDGDCSNSADCDDSFIGNSIVCSSEAFSLSGGSIQWSSQNESATSHNSPIVGDLNGDGRPEVVSTNNLAFSISVLDGQSGEIIGYTDVSFEPGNTPLIADIDNDGLVEIFISEKEGDQFSIYELDDGGLIQVGTGNASSDQSIGTSGVADFDEDGDVEIYYRNEVIDAHSGSTLISGSGDWITDWTHAPLAVDILPSSACSSCDGLELVTGNEIWSIDEANGTMEIVMDMDDEILDDIDPDLHYFPKYNSTSNQQWSSVSAADFNNDGNLDLMITGALGTTTEGGSGEGTIFFWDVTNDAVSTYSDPSNNPANGPGRIAIGDVDLDGQPNATFTMGTKLYVLDENLNILWTHSIENTHSAPTIFDLNGDSSNEVIVKDGSQVIILEGAGNGDNTTNELYSIPCTAITQEESVVIADVDGDGSVEICVACFASDVTSVETYANAEFSHIRLLQSVGNGWVPGRRVWNQYNYYNVNINDDLSVPQEVQDHSVIFSNAGTCEFSDGSTIDYPTRSINSFGIQSTILNEGGCVEYASADIDFVGIISATDLECFLDEVRVEYTISNIGDLNLYGGELHIDYFLGDPSTDGVLLDTKVHTIEHLKVAELLDIEHTITNFTSEGELFVVLNNEDPTLPIEHPISQTGINECETANNIQSTLVSYSTSPDEISKTICEGETFEFGSQTLTESGVYEESFPSADVLCQNVTLTLDVTPIKYTDEFVTICDSESYDFGNQTLTEPGTYEETFIAKSGCDSVVTLDLILYPNYESTTSQSVCKGEVFSFGDQQLSEEGEYSETFQSAFGCDSVVLLSLSVTSISTEIAISDGALSVIETEGASYQWIDCETSMPIEGATSSSFAPTASGVFSVKVSTSDCESTSDCLEAIVLGTSTESLNVYPNPVVDKLNLKLNKLVSGQICIKDLSGKHVRSVDFINKRNLAIDISDLVRGVYLIELIKSDNNQIIKIFKE